MSYQRNICLADYTTFKIGGLAKYFVEIRQIKDLIKAVDFIEKKSLPYFILGGGSNLLISDQGFNGLAIKNSLNSFEFFNNKIKAESGVLLSDLVACSANQGLTGLEWAVGIPGTIGGAIQVKASAFNQSIDKLAEKVERKKGIIIQTILKLEKGDSRQSQNLINQYLIKRKASHPLEHPSAGCIFKNPPGKFAGELIDLAGLKGKRIGQAMVSKKHANFIVNLGGAKAEQVIELIELIKKQVLIKHQVVLKEEIDYLGFNESANS